MIKSLLVLLLTALQYGCAAPTATPVQSNALISYDEIAAEIKISYQDTSGSGEMTRPVAANRRDSE